MKFVICGDVHGQSFWKKGAEYLKNNPDVKMIFLGDYLDPYTSYEGITHDQAYNNFIEIIEFARENPSKVMLLFGNHDQFLRNRYFECCRHDYCNYDRNSKLLNDNIDLFKYAHLEDGYLFTHAGVCDKWTSQNRLDNLSVEDIVTYINSAPNSLWQVGMSRGGRNRCGSPLWCCWEGDWVHKGWNNPYPVTQIFGHTRQDKSDFPKFNKEKNIYMFDVLNSFILDTETNEINLIS